jgi:hypothetical protein
VWGYLLGAALIGIGLFFARAVSASTGETMIPTIRQFFEKHGRIHGIDPDLLQAIAMQESSLRTDAVRWNPPSDVSVGLMQILAVPPKGIERGQDYTPTNRFNISPWPVTYFGLMNADVNISLGAQILSWNIQTFGYPRGIAVYNRWESRHDPINGPFGNQNYVDRVLANLKMLKGK